MGEASLDNISAEQAQLYSAAVASLDAALVSFRQLPDYVRRATEMRFWTRFRQGMHGAELNRRTLVGQRLSSNNGPPKIPRVRGLGRPKAPAKVPVRVLYV